MAFRGHHEYSEESNNGNFREIVHLLAEYHPFMEDLLIKPKGSIKYTSPSIFKVSLLTSLELL
jgi:hypothetical protein